MKHEIEVDGLPEGWKAVAFRKPIVGENYIEVSGNMGIGLATCSAQPRLIVEKIQPRRIVLEETGEFREAVKGEFCEQEDGFIFFMIRDSVGYKYKIWREVK